jgi:peptidoglycan-associated lipoprotein
MRNRIQTPLLLLLVIATAIIVPAAARAQAAPATDNSAAPELALTYTYAHSNAPPGGCGCFSLNGGSISIAVPIRHSAWSVAGDMTLARASNISAAGYDLNLSIFTGGIRYRPVLHSRTFQPFAEALAGPAFSSGSLMFSQQITNNNSNLAFSANLGGGVDLRVNHSFSFRLAEADYLLTTFDNGSNNHQNNFRISGGAVVHFGKQ